MTTIDSRRRPWAVPSTPWVMAQTWHDLLFAHWPIPVVELRALVPASMEIDTYDGDGWLGIVPFHMSGVRLRGLPGVPGVSAFPELNVRTYVRVGGKAGVWFFSLDAGSRLAVAVARRWFHLPYFDARMDVAHDGDTVVYDSTRIHRGAPPAAFRARYRAVGNPQCSAPGSLAHWLTERYCLYAVDARGLVHRGEIDHAPWPLQPAEAEIDGNAMAAASGLRLPDRRPILQFARRLDVRIWAPRRVRATEP